MGRKKLLMKKIDNPYSRQITYSKRRDGIIKKATELSVLCNTDVGLLMFSPAGQLSSFSSNGRIEDIFLRYIGRTDELRRPVESKEHLYQSLRHLKHEGEMLEKIAKMEALGEKLCELNQQQYGAKKKMRSYKLDLKKITLVREAEVHQQFIIDALRHIQKLKAKLLAKQIALEMPESIEISAVDIKDEDLTTEEFVTSKRKRNPSKDEHYCEEASLPVGPHLSIGYLKMQMHWYLQSGGHTTMLSVE